LFLAEWEKYVRREKEKHIQQPGFSNNQVKRAKPAAEKTPKR